MRFERTEWEAPEDAVNTFAPPDLGRHEQPSVGVSVLWNDRWWRPTLVIGLGPWRLQLGWLLG